jgi:hypothetical protein
MANAGIRDSIKTGSSMRIHKSYTSLTRKTAAAPATFYKPAAAHPPTAGIHYRQ